MASLRSALKAEGNEDILIRQWNHLAVVATKSECDAYEYEKQLPHERQDFSGEYMTNYLWTEYSVGRHMRMDEKAER